MGQETVGLLWGCGIPKGCRLESDAPDRRLHTIDLTVWEARCEARMAAFQRRYPDAVDPEVRFIPDAPEPLGDGPRLLGFWVALGASGMEGVYDMDQLPPCPVGDVGRLPEIQRNLRWAERRWSRFSAWCLREGVIFGVPRLWLVQTEVA